MKNIQVYISLVISLIVGIIVFRKVLAEDKKNKNLSKTILPPPKEPVIKFVSTQNDASLVTKWAKDNGYNESANPPQGYRYSTNITLLGQPLVIIIQSDQNNICVFAYTLMNRTQVSVANNPMNKFNLRMKKALKDINILQKTLTS